MSYININIENIIKNIMFIKNIQPQKNIFAVVKKNAYGLGAIKISQFIENLIYGFCVSSIEEGIELRNNNIKKDILILSGIFENDWKIAHDNSLSLVLTSIHNIDKLIDFVKKYTLKIHIKIELE